MNHLPDDILKIIWNFDNTYHEEYKKCMDQIEKSRELYNEYYERLIRRDEINRYLLHEYTYLKFTFNEYLKRQSYYRMDWFSRYFYDNRLRC